MSGKKVCLLIVCVMLLAASCSKSDTSYMEAEEASYSKMAMEEDMAIDDRLPASPSAQRSISRLSDEAPGGYEQRIEPFLGLFIPRIEDRLLEYHVILRFTSENITASRLELLTLAMQYGFLKQQQIDVKSQTPVLSAELHVRATNMYTVLTKMTGVGVLEYEEIRVVDHTETQERSRRSMLRARIRSDRRAAAMRQIAAADRSWSERENMLSASEDAEDAEAHTQWQLQDRIAWAKIFITVSGPEDAGAIKVPMYERALKDGLEILLQGAYILLQLLPLIIVVWVLFHYRKKIRGLFPKKDK
jgi:hypothetical protein